MTKAVTPPALIGRLAAAREPARLLDANIHCVVAREDFESDSDYLSVAYCYARGGWTMNAADHAFINTIVPRYTGSQDAAMKLVPDGCGVTLDRYWLREGEAWSCHLAFGGVPGNPRRVHEALDLPTAALAICVAALIARRAGDG